MMAWELTNAKNIANGNYTNHKFDALMGDKSKEEFVKGVIAIEVESAYNEVLTQLDLSEKTP